MDEELYRRFNKLTTEDIRRQNFVSLATHVAMYCAAQNRKLAEKDE